MKKVLAALALMVAFTVATPVPASAQAITFNYSGSIDGRAFHAVTLDRTRMTMTTHFNDGGIFTVPVSEPMFNAMFQMLSRVAQNNVDGG